MYNPWTGDFYWKIKPNKRIKVGSIAGSLNKISKYVVICVGKKYYAHILAWFYVKGYFPENDIDHKDRIKYHNWIANLRETSHQCNMRNIGNYKHNTSGIKGVYWDKNKNKWYSQIGVNNKRKHLGYYKDFDNAVCARLAGEQCLDWSGCDSCSPAYLYVKENLNVT